MDFENMSLAELRAYAKENNIKGTTALRKNDLMERLQEITGAKSKSSETSVSTSSNESSNAETERSAAVSPIPERKTVYERTGYESRPVGYENRYQRNDINSMRPAYQQRPQGTYQQRPGYNQDGYQNRYNQNGQGAYQNRYNQNGQGVYQSRYNQDNQGAYQNRYNQNGQGMYQNRYNQDNQGGYQNRYGQESQGMYQSRYNQDSQSMYQNRYSQDSQSTYQSRYTQDNDLQDLQQEKAYQDTGIMREGTFENAQTGGHGYLRAANLQPAEDDIYVPSNLIKKYGLRTGDVVRGSLREKNPTEKYQGLATVETINGEEPEVVMSRTKFEDLTPIFPDERIRLETPGCSAAMRLVDILSPVGKGQRGMIVSQPKAGKTTLLKQVANAITVNHPEINLMILLIDERPEEVTDIKESITSENCEVVHSTFDQMPENHKKVAEMVIERAKRMVEKGKDVCILLDSITRLARAYNLTVNNSGRTLSGGLDPAALHIPKKFFGAARNMREGGSLTILATALVETGSRMDDVVYEEFKGTGNMELVLDRSLSEKRIFPAIDLPKSGTRREDLLLTPDEFKVSFQMRRALNGTKPEEAIELILNYMRTTANNKELVDLIMAKGIFVQ